MFLIIQCNKCGERSTREVISETTYRFKCVFCGKSTKLIKKGLRALNVWECDDFKHSQAVMLEIARRRHQHHLKGKTIL